MYIGTAKDAPAWVSQFLSQGPTSRRISTGPVKDAPAWVWQVPKLAFPHADQLAANAAWVKFVEWACAQERADAHKAYEKAQAARAEYAADPRNRTLMPDAGGPQLTAERGVILAYDPNTLEGVISAEDGKRWSFRAAEWPERARRLVSSAIGADPGDDPKPGLWVDFVPEPETGYALFVYSLGPFTAKHLHLLQSPR